MTLRSTVVMAVLAAGALAAACGDEDTDTGGRGVGVFVATYIDLRMATLRAGVDQLPVSVRDSILTAHEVTKGDLLQFAEVHGRDARFMQAVWDSIETGWTDCARPSWTRWPLR